MVFSLLRFVVGWTCRTSEVLRLNFLDVKLRYALAHRFQNILERWRFTLDPSQRVDARNHERAQVWADETTFFQFLHRCRDFLLKIEHHRGPFFVILDGGAERFISKGLQASQD